ncbi:MAG TPA: hypothetical protein GXX40_01360 [Firmicutes bacterium]|nr:hypothetical protein [Bacillota bacterium]
MYWGAPGEDNTEVTLRAAFDRARTARISYVVVASTTGKTAMAAAEIAAENPDIKVTVVTHHAGFKSPGHQEMATDVVERLKAAGINVLTTTHLFANVERAVVNKFGGLYVGGVISETLRMFGQGTKVCVEIATMALDAGLIPHGVEVIAVAGSGRGADTALILKPAHANEFFNTEILEVVCKPRKVRR